MTSTIQEGFGPLEPALLERRLRQLAERHAEVGIVDDLELRHLVTVILHGAVLLHDLYTTERIGSLYAADPRIVARGLIGAIPADTDASNLEHLSRVGRLPEEVRLLGDKCLFDIGISHLRRYRGLNLQDLGERAYRMASEILSVLGEDAHLREYFDRNRLSPLPIGEEITFLKQCAERFGIHAELLERLRLDEPLGSDTTTGIIVPSRGADCPSGEVSLAPLKEEHRGEAPEGKQSTTRQERTSAPEPSKSAIDQDRTDGPHASEAATEQQRIDGPLALQSRMEQDRTSTAEASQAATERDRADGLLGAVSGPDALPPGAFSDFEGLRLSREDLLSSYERIVLFASLDIEHLKQRLESVVIDQKEAIEALCDEFALFAAGTHSLTRPPSYFFVGPTGVGKNHLVETLVRLLEEAASAEIPFLTIDGPNYTDASDINELRGSTRGFIRSDEEGLLAEFHERSSQSPLSVILVDEIEKAHPHLRKFFLSLMDRGTVTDNRGRTLAFPNVMLFFTSNLGFSESVARGTPIGYTGEESHEAFEQSEVGRALRHALSAEFVNRLRIIRFEHLSRGSIERISELEMERVRRRFLEVHGLSLVVTPQAAEAMIARGYSRDYGARHLAGVINRIANVEVSKRLRRDELARKQGPRARAAVETKDAITSAEATGSLERAESAVLEYLRQVRRKERAFDPREARERVLRAARARVPYTRLTIDFENGEFLYRT